MERWREYVEELYSDQSGDILDLGDNSGISPNSEKRNGKGSKMQEVEESRGE